MLMRLQKGLIKSVNNYNFTCIYQYLSYICDGMEEYELRTTNGDVIKKITANDRSDAISYFSKMKMLTEDLLVSIFIVEKVS